MSDDFQPRPEEKPFSLSDQKPNQEILADEIHRHIVSNLGEEIYGKNQFRYFNGLAYSLRDRLIQAWLNTQRDYYDGRLPPVVGCCRPTRLYPVLSPKPSVPNG